MTSRSATEDLPSPQVFTIFPLPSYEDAVKSSGEPPSYEQALTDLRVDSLEDIQRNNNPFTPSTQNHRNHAQISSRQKRCNNRFYKGFCWSLAILFILVLGYMIYTGIFRYMANTDKT